MKTKDLKKLIGKRVQWQDARTGLMKTGQVEVVQGGNLMISGVWHYYDAGKGNMRDLRREAL